MNLRGLPRYFQLVKTCHHSCSVPNWLTHKTWICTPLFTGKSKANLGWTPLHLGAYFGHSEVVRALLEVSLVRNNFWPLYNSRFWFLECLVDFPTEIFLTILLPVYVFHKLKYLNCYHKKYQISNIKYLHNHFLSSDDFLGFFCSMEQMWMWEMEWAIHHFTERHSLEEQWVLTDLDALV